MTKRYFMLLNETQGVSCGNYLPWGEKSWPEGQATSVISTDLQGKQRL